MKTDITTPGSFAQSHKKAMALKESQRLSGGIVPQMRPSSDSGPGPDYKLDLSSKAPSTSSPSLPAIPTPSFPKLPDLPKEIIKEEIKPEVVKKVEEAPGSVKKPAILFIKGLDVFSSPSTSERGYAGVGKIAESIEGSRIYGWDQKDEILKEIIRTHKDSPVILVGHSLGGDTAIEIANELDTLKHKFRNIDLLVTMDAVGLGNDIIPQNVKKHLNVFGENDLFLNDGPHVARRHEKTSVKNILSALDHTEIDDDKEVQYEIVDFIQNALKSSQA